MTEIDLKARQFLDALDHGDLQSLSWLWQQASEQPELGQLFAEMMEEAAREIEPANGWQTDVAKVQALLRQHIPSAFPQEMEVRLLMTSDIAAKLHELIGGFPESDQLANNRLLADRTLLPDELGVPQLRAWIDGLNVPASDRYWKQFRKTAVLLRISRGQQGAKLLAARQAAEQ
ncbi:MAG TPA: hypothetical protein VGZ47_19490 [Gemmataceae bacterium]|jgi:hypothetical protein|nr:hypothetical protein [Gemmataceae bacterium]